MARKKQLDFAEAVEIKAKADIRAENTEKLGKKMTKFADKKELSYRYTEFAQDLITPNMLERGKSCGSFVEIGHDIEFSQSGVVNANLCGNRFCPICSWIKSRRDTLQLATELQYLHTEQKLEFLFLTLTIRNVKAEELESAIQKLNYAYKKLRQLKEVEQISYGEIKKLEVTYNSNKKSKSYKTYHPHLHVVIGVSRSYFSSNHYLNKQKWLDMWRKCYKDDSITQVKVKRVKTSKDIKHVLEIAKYSAKEEDYLYSKEVFRVFYKALKGKQIMSKSGCFLEARKLWEAGELDGYLEEYKNKVEYVYISTYSWYFKNEFMDFSYNLNNVRKITVKEYKTYNKHTIDTEFKDSKYVEKDIRNRLENVKQIETKDLAKVPKLFAKSPKKIK